MRLKKSKPSINNESKNSLSLRKVSRYLLGLLFVITCILGALLYSSFRYSANDSRAKVMSSVETQMNQIERELYNVSYYLFSLVMNNDDTQTIRESDNVNIYNTAARTLWDDLEYQSRIFGSVFSFMIYIPEKNITVHNRGTTIAYDIDEAIISEIKKGIDNEEYTYNNLDWNILVSDDQAYLLQLYYKDGAYSCSWVSCNIEFSFFTMSTVYQDPYLIILDKNNSPIFTDDIEEFNKVSFGSDGKISGEIRRDYYFYSLNHSDINLIFCNKTAFNYPRMLFLTTMYLLILFTILAFYIYTLLYYKRYIEIPLQTLHNQIADYASMQKKAKRKGFSELVEATETLDLLKHQLDQLKIDYYEKELMLAKTELDYYQLQIKPHFFINCLNIIFSMVQKKEYKRIQEFCLCLSNYVRYLFSHTFSTVPLHDELVHLLNYLRIQSIRHRASVTFNEKIDPEVNSFNIPPLLFITFIENSIKYSGLSPNDLIITLNVKMTEKNEKKFIQIEIIDNGMGFADNKLDEIYGEFKNDSNHTHKNIGIINIYRRLELLYGEQFKLKISNTENGGANVKIEIPAFSEKNKTELL